MCPRKARGAVSEKLGQLKPKPAHAQHRTGSRGDASLWPRQRLSINTLADSLCISVDARTFLRVPHRPFINCRCQVSICGCCESVPNVDARLTEHLKTILQGLGALRNGPKFDTRDMQQQPIDDGSDLEDLVVYADDDTARGRLAQVCLIVYQGLHPSMLASGIPHVSMYAGCHWSAEHARSACKKVCSAAAATSVDKGLSSG